MDWANFFGALIKVPDRGKLIVLLAANLTDCDVIEWMERFSELRNENWFLNATSKSMIAVFPYLLPFFMSDNFVRF